MVESTELGGVVRRVTNRFWQEASFAVNYHLRGRWPTAVCAVEGRWSHWRDRRVGAGPCCWLTPEGPLSAHLSFLEPRLHQYYAARLGAGGESRPVPDTIPDLEVVEIPARQKVTWARRGYLIQPIFVRQVLPLYCRTHVLPQSKHTKQRVRHLKRRGYEYEVARDRASFDFFYEQMYVPTMKARHGGAAYVRGRDYVWRGFCRGTLLFIRQGGQRVAGILNVPLVGEPDLVSTWAGGMRHGDLRLVEDGADSACVYFTLLWAKACGVRRVSLSVTRPFLDDGLLSFRKRWGAELEPEPYWAWSVVALRINRWTDAVAAVMRRNPMVVLRAEGLVGLVSWDPEASRSFAEISTPGLGAMTLLTRPAHAQLPPRHWAGSIFELPVGRETAAVHQLARGYWHAPR